MIRGAQLFMHVSTVVYVTATWINGIATMSVSSRTRTSIFVLQIQHFLLLLRVVLTIVVAAAAAAAAAWIQLPRCRHQRGGDSKPGHWQSQY